MFRLSCVCYHCGSTYAYTENVKAIVKWQDTHFCPPSKGKARVITLVLTEK